MVNKKNKKFKTFNWGSFWSTTFFAIIFAFYGIYKYILNENRTLAWIDIFFIIFFIIWGIVTFIILMRQSRFKVLTKNMVNKDLKSIIIGYLASDDWDLYYEDDSVVQAIHGRNDGDFDILTLKFSDKNVRYNFSRFPKIGIFRRNKTEAEFINKLKVFLSK